MADTPEETLRRFFSRYADASLEGNIDLIAAAYAPTYIESSPDSFAAWKVDAAYRSALAERHALMQDQLGLSSLTLTLASVEEVAPRHFLARVSWSMTFDKARRGKVTSVFDITYIVKLSGQPQILAYLSHESEAAVMRRDGII